MANKLAAFENDLQNAKWILNNVEPELRSDEQCMQVIKFLQSIEYLSKGDPEDFIELGRNLQIRTFKETQVVCKEGELGEHVFYILKGKVAGVSVIKYPRLTQQRPLRAGSWPRVRRDRSHPRRAAPVDHQRAVRRDRHPDHRQRHVHQVLRQAAHPVRPRSAELLRRELPDARSQPRVQEAAGEQKLLDQVPGQHDAREAEQQGQHALLHLERRRPPAAQHPQASTEELRAELRVQERAAAAARQDPPGHPDPL